MSNSILDMDERLTLRTRDGMELSARRLRTADGPALQAFNAALLPDSRRKFLPHAYDDTTVATVLARSEAGEDLTLGLFDGDRLVGYFFLWRVRRRVPLLGIGMLDAYHHRGLGHAMMAILLDQGRTAGCEGIELTTQLDNDNAFALYRKMGFTYFGNVENRTGDGRTIVERGMFYPIKPGASRMQDPHAPPV